MITQKLPKSQNRSGTAAFGNGTAAIPTRCPRCDDELVLYHSQNGRAQHFLGCQAFPSCTYTCSYDDRIHELLHSLSQRLTFWEAQTSWLMTRVEELAEGGQA